VIKDIGRRNHNTSSLDLEQAEIINPLLPPSLPLVRPQSNVVSLEGTSSKSKLCRFKRLEMSAHNIIIMHGVNCIFKHHYLAHGEEHAMKYKASTKTFRLAKQTENLNPVPLVRAPKKFVNPLQMAHTKQNPTQQKVVPRC
jgi:hypothetical protein